MSDSINTSNPATASNPTAVGGSINTLVAVAIAPFGTGDELAAEVA